MGANIECGRLKDAGSTSGFRFMSETCKLNLLKQALGVKNYLLNVAIILLVVEMLFERSLEDCNDYVLQRNRLSDHRHVSNGKCTATFRKEYTLVSSLLHLDNN